MPQLTQKQSTFLELYLGHRPAVADALKKSHPQEPAQGASVNTEENNRLSQLSAQELAKTVLIQCDMNVLFSKANMLALKDAEFKGEGTPALKKLMEQVEKGFPSLPRDDVMKGLETIVGIPPTAERLHVEYDRFVILRKQQGAIGEQKEQDDPSGLSDMHKDFMGSRSQLMFGKVLGDAFGIHEIFAALLSPTGGLVGPGNLALQLDADDPIALHGTVHDAGGYLKTYHDQGPGYNYLNHKWEFLGPDSCISGQVSGILFWVKEAGAEYEGSRTDAVLINLEKGLKSARDAVATAVDDLLSVFKSQPDDAVETAPGAALDVAQAIHDASNKVAKTVAEPYDAAAKDVQKTMDDTAKDKVKAASNFIWE